MVAYPSRRNSPVSSASSSSSISRASSLVRCFHTLLISACSDIQSRSRTSTTIASLTHSIAPPLNMEASFALTAAHRGLAHARVLM
jgi:hypothetical protein